jgi:predicted dehydrogenase
LSVSAAVLVGAQETWHPNPDIFFADGAGPLLDMGPYYLTALVSLLGPIARVAGSARASFPERVIGNGPRQGERIEVRVPTHVAGVVDFASGAIGTLVTSFDVWGSTLPRIEVYGSEGSLSVPDPNGFAGLVHLWPAGSDRWVEVEEAGALRGRGVGVADLAAAVLEGRPHRATGELALHVLEVMTAVERSSREGEHIRIETAPERPAPLEDGA